MKLLTRHNTILMIMLLLFSSAAPAQQGRAYPPNIPTAKAVTFKTVDAITLKLWIIEPAAPAPSPAPAFVFFFGGGWNDGSPEHFARQANYLAELGVTSFLADYRVNSRHGTIPAHSVEDAKSAVRWVRTHAAQYNIDPQKIVAAGGSSGGHLAAATALLSGFTADEEDLSVSSEPNALVLFNPVLIVDSVAGVYETAESLKQRMGDIKLSTISPYHHLRESLPPTIVFHGTADGSVPFDTVVEFCEKSLSHGNVCDVLSFPDQAHGFFNYEPHLSETLDATKQFLSSLEWVD